MKRVAANGASPIGSCGGGYQARDKIHRKPINTYNQRKKKAEMEKQGTEDCPPPIKKSLFLVQCPDLSHFSDLKPIDLKGGNK